MKFIIYRLFVFCISIFATFNIFAQELIAYLPLTEDAQGYQVEYLQDDNTRFSIVDGENCVQFTPIVQNKLDNDNYGIEYFSKQVHDALDSGELSFQMDFYCSMPHDPDRRFDRRILQIGGDDDFAFRQKDWDDFWGTYSLEYRALGNYLGTINYLTLDRWYTLHFDLYNDSFKISLIEKRIGKLEYRDSNVLNNGNQFENNNINAKITLGNKTISSPDQLQGAVKNVIFSTGNNNYIKNDKTLNFSNPEFNIKMEALDGYLIKASAIKECTLNDTVELIWRSHFPNWLVQGNVLQNDDYSTISDDGDSMKYDAWIDRGSWVTLQAFEKMGNGDLNYSNIVRVYIEEELSDISNFENFEARIADNGESLQLITDRFISSEMIIYTLDSKIVRTVKNKNTISTLGLPAGIYLLSYKNESGDIKMIKWAK